MNTIREYLDTMVSLMEQHKVQMLDGLRWPSQYHFLLEHGVAMAPVVMAEKRGPIKHCYHTSSMRALRKRGPIYCEGFAIPKGLFPMEHAWLLDEKEMKVIETTWREPGTEYFGVAFKTQFLRDSLRNRKYYGLINAWEHHFPILKMTDKQLTERMHPVMKGQ